MRIVLSALGRFHSFDLARQMHRRGALKMIFSGYPRFKLSNERLPHPMIRTFPWLHAPYMKLGAMVEQMRVSWEWQDRLWFDKYVARNLPECEVFCALSGAGLYSGRAARSRGARYVCDRGSSHIRVQDRLLREEYDRQGIPFRGIDPRTIEREEREYELADAIATPSRFAFRSFAEAGVPKSKLRLLPYGVDPSTFHTGPSPDPEKFQVLFAGNICVRKGVRYLLDAFDRMQVSNKRLLFAGAVSSEMAPAVARLRDRTDIAFTGPVPQWRLRQHMCESDVLVLPSIEEGLALVQAQALACGCPIIGTTNSGAEDLIEDGVEGFVVPVRSADALAHKLTLLAEDRELRRGMRAAALRNIQARGGWDAYGDAAHRVYSELTQ